MKDIKKNKVEHLETKITMCEVKNILQRLNGRLAISEKKISEGEDIATGTIQTGLQREKGVLKKNRIINRASVGGDNFRQPSTHVTRLPKGEGRKVEAERNI